jgi:hypothetical protein
MHLNDGQIRAYLDGEADGMDQIARHLAACPECQARLRRIETQTRLIRSRLAFLTPQTGDQEADPRLAGRPQFAKLKQNIEEKETSMFHKFFNIRSRALWASLAIVLVLAVGLSFPTGRTWAAQFLDLFRVQQVTVIPIDPSGFSLLSGDSILGKQVGQLLASSITMDKKPGPPQVVADAAAASQAVGFEVRLPANPTASQIVVRDGAAFKFTVDRGRAQALLDESGHQDLVLPASLDGARVSVNIPASVGAAYGNCPRLDSQEEGTAVGMNGSAGRRYPDCVILAEIPSPTVETPPDVDLQKLAVIGLEFTGMTPEQAQAYSQTVDWTSTLVVPIPMNAATYQQVNVDGVTGTLIQRPVDDAPQYALIWVKDGIIYAIGGLGSDTTRAIDMANSLK